MMKMFTKRMNNKKGFTLIELIVVIAILGILASIAVPRFAGFTDDAKQKADKANEKLLYNVTNIAITEDKVTVPASTAADLKIDSTNFESKLGDYLDAWPEYKQDDSKAFEITVTKGTGKVTVAPK